MLLSIIMPVYNVKCYLRNTVSSVLNQTFTDFELILVDDGSDDGSGGICDDLAKTDSRIKVVHQENSGVSEARNTGLKAASGDYIGWVDSDDIIEPDMFEKLMTVAVNENVDIVQCEHDRGDRIFNSGENADFKYSFKTAKELIDTQYTLKGDRCTNFLALWSKVYKKELFNGLSFPVGRTHEDHALMCRIVMNAERIAVSDCVLYHYVRRDNSIITGFAPKKYRDMAEALYDNAVYLKDYDAKLYKKAVVSYRNIIFRHCSCFYNNYKSSNEHLFYFDIIKKRKTLIKEFSSFYDRLYINLICLGIFKNLIAKNDFEPLQKFITKIKG